MGYFYVKQFRQTPFQKNSPENAKNCKKIQKIFLTAAPGNEKKRLSPLITPKSQKKRAEACPYHSLQINDGKKQST